MAAIYGRHRVDLYPLAAQLLAAAAEDGPSRVRFSLMIAPVFSAFSCS
jgi:hypothetical protein